MVISKAKQLLDNGYQVIPITSMGEPCVSGFFDAEYKSTVVQSWAEKFPDANIALVAGQNNVYAIDIDVDYPKLATKLQRVLRKEWPTMPIRRCNDPRFAALFRVSDPALLEVTNASSNGYKWEGKDSLQRIEIMGRKTLTMYGQHRKTGNKYKWVRNTSPMDTHIEDLPELSLKDVQKILSFLDRHVPPEFTKVSNGSFSKPKKEVTFETVRISKTYNEEDITDLLSRSNGDDRESWRDMGFALHQHYNGSVEGLRRWDEWSQRFDKYKGIAACRKQYKKFRVDGGITLQTIENRLKKKEKPPEDLLKEFVDNVVVIATNTKIADLRRPPFEALKKYNEYVFMNTHNLIPMEKQNQKTGETTIQNVNVMQAWKLSPDRIICDDVEYYPVRQRLLKGHWEDRDGTYYNTYVPPVTKYTNDDDLIHFFLDHMEYLFPNDGDLDWMLSWMAQLVREPEIRYRVAPLSISMFHGTGRGWLGKLLGRLVGDNNLSKVGRMSELVREGAKTGFMNNSTLCVISETHSGEKRYAIDDRLRDILGENKQNVDIKYGEQKDKEIYTRFFFQSNHIDALVIDDVDNRIEVLINKSLPKSPEYYDALYEVLENKDSNFIDQVYSHLVNYKINYKWLKQSRNTPARATLIKASKSKTANAVMEFKMIVGDNIFTEKQFDNFLSEYMSLVGTNNELGSSINMKELSFIKRDQIITKQYLKVNGVKSLVQSFVFHDTETISGQDVVRMLKKSQAKIKLFFKQYEQGNY